jgi:hypothetical protein
MKVKGKSGRESGCADRNVWSGWSGALVVTAVVLLGDIVERPTQRYLVTEVLNMWEVSMGGSHIPIGPTHLRTYIYIYISSHVSDTPCGGG